MVKRLKEKIVIYKYHDGSDSSDDSDYVPPEDTESDSSESDCSDSVESDCSGDVLPTDSEDSVYKS